MSAWTKWVNGTVRRSKKLDPQNQEKHGKLGGGWFNPFEKYAPQIGWLSPRRVRNQKSIKNNLWNHHLEKDRFALLYLAKYSIQFYPKRHQTTRKETNGTQRKRHVRGQSPQHPPHHRPTSSRCCRFEGLETRPTSRVHRTAFHIATTLLLRFFEREDGWR